jgi:hypothetical protein
MLKTIVTKGLIKRSLRYFASNLPEFDPKANYYKVLGVAETASEADIKKEYYKLA